jgi:hypothetical protein
MQDWVAKETVAIKRKYQLAMTKKTVAVGRI